MHKIMIRPADYFSCREAIDRAFQLFPLNVRGKKVLVKPNAVMASHPDEAIVTHPAVIGAVIEKLENLDPAEIIVGDNPGFLGYGINESTFRRTGLLVAAKGHYRNIGTDALEVNFSKKFGGRLSLSRDVLEADIIISVPKFKTHGLTIITGGIKNSYGLPGAYKAMLHRVAGVALRFSELLIDVFQVKVPSIGRRQVEHCSCPRNCEKSTPGFLKLQRGNTGQAFGSICSFSFLTGFFFFFILLYYKIISIHFVGN